jgi:hypothetical protein
MLLLKLRHLFGVLLLAVGLPATAQNAESFPAFVGTAKTVFLLDAGSNGAAFDAFAAAVKQWNRYKIVPSQDDADLVIQFRYKLIVTSQNVWTSRSLTTGNIETVKTDNTEGELSVLLFDPKTKDVYGTLSERSKKKKDQEVAEAARRLVYRLRSRVPEVKKTPGPGTKTN